MSLNNSLPDGTKKTIAYYQSRIRTLEHLLRRIRADILDGLRDYEEEEATSAELVSENALRYLKTLEQTIATYVGNELPLK